MLNYYEVLGVSPKASHDDIRAAYKDLMKKWHPDQFMEAGEAKVAEATRHSQEIGEAWFYLSDPGRRSNHDHNLNTPRSTSGRSRRTKQEQTVQEVFDRLVTAKVRAGWRKRAAQAQVLQDITNLSNDILAVTPYPRESITDIELDRLLAERGAVYSLEEFVLARHSLLQQGKLAVHPGNFGVVWYYKTDDPITLTRDDIEWLTGTGYYAQ